MLAPLPPLPPRLQVEVTNRCALGCTSCARHHWDVAANPIGDMTQDVLDRLDPLFDGAIEVTVGGYGDPTEGPMLLPLVRRAKAAGCSVRMITGGAKLTTRLIEELADAGLDRLVLSMDGATDATLRNLRGVPLRAWLKWIRAARPLRPIVQLNFVAQWPNISELPALVQLCDDEGVAGIHAFHLKSYTPQTLDRCLLTDPERAQPHFDAAEALARRLGVFLHLPTNGGCRQPFEHLFVRHDGAVRGCCSGLFEPADFGLVAGRIEDGPEALWAAPILQQFRAASAGDAEYPRPCVGCAWRVPTLAAHTRPLAVLRA